MKLFIKNMVCPRCISAVRNVLDELQLQPHFVELGEASIAREPGDDDLAVLNRALKAQGFELLEDNKTQIIEKNQICNYKSCASF